MAKIIQKSFWGNVFGHPIAKLLAIIQSGKRVALKVLEKNQENFVYFKMSSLHYIHT